jgi:hypothetical protein
VDVVVRVVIDVVGRAVAIVVGSSQSSKDGCGGDEARDVALDAEGVEIAITGPLQA